MNTTKKPEPETKTKAAEKPAEQVPSAQVNPIPVGDADPNIAVGSATDGVPIAGGKVAKVASEGSEPLSRTVEKAKFSDNASKFAPEGGDKIK